MTIALGEAVVVTVPPPLPVISTARPVTPSVAVVPVVGPAGPPGGYYAHHQATAAATWVITHNLGRYIEPVLLLDAEPARRVWGDYEFTSPNSLTITLPSPVTGWAYF